MTTLEGMVRAMSDGSIHSDSAVLGWDAKSLLTLVEDPLDHIGLLGGLKEAADLAVKRANAEVDVVETILDECITDFDKHRPFVRRMALQAVRPVVVSELRTDKIFLGGGIYAVVVAYLGAAVLATAGISVWVGSTYDAFFIGFANCLVPIILVQGFPTNNIFARALSSVALAACVTALAAVGYFLKGEDPAWWIQVAAAVPIVLAPASLVFLAIFLLERRYKSAVPAPYQLFVDLVQLIAISDFWANSIRGRAEALAALRGDKEADVADELENVLRSIFRAARGVTTPRFLDDIRYSAQRAAAGFQRLAPRDDKELSAHCERYGSRIAATIRAHARYVVLPGEAGPQAVVNSFANALLMVSHNKWDQLAIVDPMPKEESFVRRYTSRGVIAAVLLLAAIFMPIILPDWVSSEQTLSFRVTLVTTAIFSLLAPVDKSIDAARNAIARSR